MQHLTLGNTVLLHGQHVVPCVLNLSHGPPAVIGNAPLGLLPALYGHPQEGQMILAGQLLGVSRQHEQLVPQA